MTWLPVASLAQLKHSQRLCVQVEGRPLLLLWHNHQAYALENRCSHANKPLEQGKLRDNIIQCPYHGATFDITTGEHLSAPAFKGIQTFPVQITDSTVNVKLQTTED